MPRQWLLFLSARLLQSVSHRISPPKFLGFHLNSLFSLANLPVIFSCQLKHFNILPGKDNFCYLESFAVQDNATSVKITTTTIIKGFKTVLVLPSTPSPGDTPLLQTQPPCTDVLEEGSCQGLCALACPVDQDPPCASENSEVLASASTTHPQKDKPATSRFLQINALNYMVEMDFRKQHIVLVGFFF